MKKIAILMAMEAEAIPLMKPLNLDSTFFFTGTPFKTWYNENIRLVLSGKDKDHGVDNVGTQPATLMTYLAIQQFNPDIIINAGTAGGFEARGCEIGDVYLSEGFSYHDRRIPIPGFQEYGVGSYPSFDTSEIAKELNLKTGKISTGNSLDLEPEDLMMMYRSYATIKDMEAAAIAWVCKTMNVPMFAVKSITDLIDIKKPTPEQFLKNLDMATENLKESVLEVIRILSEK